MSDIDRKAIANYFKPFPKWAVWCIVIGVALLFTEEQSSVVIGIILIAIGIIRLVTMKRPSDQQMDQWWQQEDASLMAKSLGKAGFDSADCVAEPVTVWGPRVASTGGVPIQLKKGKDDVVRYNPVDVSILNFGEHQLIGYQTAYDRLTGNALQEATDEYFYKDVVSVSTKTDTTSRDVVVNKEKTRIQLKNSEMFRLTTSGGTSIDVFLRDEALLQAIKGGSISTTQAEQAVQSVRRMLRDKKSVT